jgi:hypothetical protein
MNFTFELTMTFISAGGTGSITHECTTADLSNVKFTSSNVGGGRQEDQISGTVIIREADYIAFTTRLNDPTYYINSEAFSYKLYLNDEQVNTNKIRLINNNQSARILTFQLYDNAINQYTNLYANWANELNIMANVSGTGNVTGYTDFRTLVTVGGETKSNVNFGSSENYKVREYIENTLIPEYDYKIPSSILFAYVAAFTYTPIVTYKQFEAVGYYNGTKKEPPAGINWIYDSDVSGQPKFNKKPKLIDIDISTFNWGLPSTVTLSIEQEADITYSSVARDLQDTIEYLVGEADSSVAFDSNSFDGLNDVVGEGTFESTDKFCANLKLMVVSDFIPTLAGNRVTNIATKGVISLAVIFDFLEQLGFYWYLEDIAGTYYFRVQHITTVSFGTSNPDLETLKGKDWTRCERILNESESIYNKVTNGTVSGDYNFREPEFIFNAGERSQSLTSQRIFTDINHILDGKESVCDPVSGEQWVLLTNSGNKVRPFTSALNSISTNNYELSFYWLTRNLIKVPGKYDENETSYDDDRLQRSKIMSIEVPIDNPQTDFDFYDTIKFWTKNTELQRVERDCLSTMGRITMKYFEVLPESIGK